MLSRYPLQGDVVKARIRKANQKKIKINITFSMKPVLSLFQKD